MMKKTNPIKLFEEALYKYGQKFGIDERYAKMLTLLAERPRTFKELMADTGIPQPTLARRIAWLLEEGYIKKYDTKRETFYAPRVIYATDYFGFSNLLRKVLNEMEIEMDKLRVYIALYRQILDKFEYPLEE